MPMAFEIYGACSEKFEDFLKKLVKATSESCSLFSGFIESLEKAILSYSANFHCENKYPSLSCFI